MLILIYLCFLRNLVKKKQVKKWFTSSPVTPEPHPLPLFSQYCKVSKGNYVYKPGCGRSCENQFGSHTEVCPSCRKFIWHLQCLQSYCQRLKLEIPDTSTEKWSCPHCVLRKKITKN